MYLYEESLHNLLCLLCGLSPGLDVDGMSGQGGTVRGQLAVHLVLGLLPLEEEPQMVRNEAVHGPQTGLSPDYTVRGRGESVVLTTGGMSTER